MEPGKVKQDENEVLNRERKFLHHGSVKLECPKNFNPYLSAHAACDVQAYVAGDLLTRKFIA